VGIGASLHDGFGNDVWENLLLKWYDNAGKLKYVKFHLDWSSAYLNNGRDTSDDLALDYGEVNYTNDEIHLRDVYSNVEILRVKLDNMGRPAVTWYYNPNSRSAFAWPKDTSYYYYSSSNRIDSIIQHKSDLDGKYPFVIPFKFNYDPDGNLVSINSPGGIVDFEFRYDYTQLNHGMATVNMFTAPTKMLEFMDLLTFEQHHQLKEVREYSGGYFVHDWNYERITRDSDGKVTSWGSGYLLNRWYTAWDCNSSTIVSSKNPTQDEFMRMIH
jgi:hypothetical protein